MAYQDYMISSEWRIRRDLIKSRDRYRCRLCHSPDDLQVHHATYKNVRQEEDVDLITLCRGCHETHHGQKKRQEPQHLWSLSTNTRWLWLLNLESLGYRPIYNPVPEGVEVQIEVDRWPETSIKHWHPTFQLESTGHYVQVVERSSEQLRNVNSLPDSLIPARLKRVDQDLIFTNESFPRTAELQQSQMGLCYIHGYDTPTIVIMGVPSLYYAVEISGRNKGCPTGSQIEFKPNGTFWNLSSWDLFDCYPDEGGVIQYPDHGEGSIGWVTGHE